MSGAASVLVAGIGNIFFADDGFGVAVAQRLLAQPPMPGVKVEDFGIRGVHLAYEMLEGYDLVVMVDALPAGEAPGTVSVIEADQAAAQGLPVDAHTMNPMAVLSMLADLGGTAGRVLVVGCEPAEIEERIGLSAVVAGVVDETARLVTELVGTETAVPAGKEH
ncbi:MAG: hydrogenase maturation protease [Acidimicrobiales bacterium]